MAEKKETKKAKEIKEKPTKKKEVNLEERVTVISFAEWETTFKRIQDNGGSVRVSPHGNMRLSRNEIIAQVQDGNVFFVGIDGKGSHATYYIDDEETREIVGFDCDAYSQNILTIDKAKELFGLPQNEFEKKLPDYVVTRVEKRTIMNHIKDLNLNDYRKIRAIEKYTNYKIIS